LRLRPRFGKIRTLVHRASDKRLVWLICVGLGLATICVFWRVTTHSFIDYDDLAYVTDNPQVQAGLSLKGLTWAFTHIVAGNWHPITVLSHMMDCSLFGLNAGRHHLTNLILHTANVVLLFLALRGLTGAVWPSAFVAALFGLHPLHVESVAWVAERKDVLSAFFLMLTLWAYARYVHSYIKGQVPSVGCADFRAQVPDPDSSGPQLRPEQASRITHLSAEASAKADHALVGRSLRGPASRFYLLALLFFALGLMSKPMLVTVPFILLLLDYWPLGRFGKPANDAHRSSIPKLRSTLTAHLRALSPLVIEKIPFFVLAGASSVITLLAQRREGAVAPLEIVSLAGRLQNAVVAYLTYLEKMVWPANLAVLYLRPLEGWPSWQVTLGTLVVGSFSVAAMLPVFRRKRPYVTVGWLWFLGMLVPVIGIIQVGTQAFADRYTYLPLIGCFIIVAWGCSELFDRYRVKRQWAAGLSLLTITLSGLTAYREAGYWKDSVTLFTRCLAVTDRNYVAHNILAVAFSSQARFEEAKAEFQEALRIYPQYASALRNLGVLLAVQGDFDAARSWLSQALRLEPDSALAYGKLAFVLDARGKTKQAVEFYREYLGLKPDDEKACNNLAWILATYPDPTIRNGPEAVGWGEHGCELTHYKETIFVGTLAAAYAEAGRFEEAVATAQKAIALASAAGQRDLEQKNRQLLELYRAGKAFHEDKTQDNRTRSRQPNVE
jgi:Flp pilus assembly protein TadD